MESSTLVMTSTTSEHAPRGPQPSQPQSPSRVLIPDPERVAHRLGRGRRLTRD